MINYVTISPEQLKKIMAASFNVSTFELMVDVNTGVLIQYIGYDDNGEISDYIYTENISFENKADKVERFSNNELTGYEEYQKN